MTVLHEPAECDRVRNAERKERLARLSPVLLAISAPAALVPEPVSVKVKCVEPVPAPHDVNRYPRQSFLVDHCQKGETKSDDQPEPVPSMWHIKNVVARKYKVTVIDLESKRRTMDVVWPRHVAVYLCATMTHRALPAIGRAFGGRDHTTALHSRDKIKRLLAEEILAKVETLRNELDALKTLILATMTDGGNRLPHGKTFSEHSGTSG